MLIPLITIYGRITRVIIVVQIASEYAAQELASLVTMPLQHIYSNRVISMMTIERKCIPDIRTTYPRHIQYHESVLLIRYQYNPPWIWSSRFYIESSQMMLIDLSTMWMGSSLLVDSLPTGSQGSIQGVLEDVYRPWHYVASRYLINGFPRAM